MQRNSGWWNEEELDKEELEGMGWMCLRHMYV